MKRIFFTIVVIGIALLAFVFYRQHRRTKETPESNAGMTNMEAKTASSAERKNDAPTGTGNDPLAKMGITPEMTQQQREEKFKQWYITEASKMEASRQRNISFFGQTVDRDNRPIPGVDVHLILSESPASPDGIVETHLQTDAQGYFGYSNAVGHLLQVWLSKDGYYVPKSNRVDFDFTNYQPDPSRPEVFYLLKKGPGAKLITSQKGVYRTLDFDAPKDGSPVWVDFFNRAVGTTGQMGVSTIKPPKTDYRGPKAWSFSMSIPDGGFIEQNDEFPFAAPESGYQPTVTFDFQPGQTNWTDTISKHYYIKFGSPPKYGRIDVQTRMYQGVWLFYAINPDGSPNLEPQ